MKTGSTGLRPLLILSLLVLAAPLHARPKYKVTFLLGHPNLDYFEEAAQSFKTAVEKGSKGDIEVLVKTADNPWEDTAQGLPGPEVATKVAKGEAEMGHSFTDTMGSLDHRLWVFDAPFLFRGYEHLEQVFEGPVGAGILDGMRQHQLVGLAFTYSGGANMISSLERPLREPADLKGLKVAVFGGEVDSSWLRALGAEPVSFKHREDNIPALTEGKAIDAATLTWRRHYRVLRRAKNYRYGSLEGSTYLVSMTYINAKFLDSLPPAYRELIVSATKEASRIERAKTIELNEVSKRRMVSAGMQAVPLTAAARRRFETALRPVYEREIEPLVGKELVERIRGTGDGRLASKD